MTKIEIALVEDNDDDAELAIRALTRNKVASDIFRLADGEAAILALLGDTMPRPRLVLLDLKLPKVDGLEVLRRIRAETKTATLPVVVLTSSGQDRDIERAYALGANSYVVKPVAFDRFSEVVESIGAYWLRVNEGPRR